MSDFEVEISGHDGSYRVVARSAAGETSAVPVRFPFDELALSRSLQAMELALLRSSASVRRLTPVDERPVQEFGRQLFEFAFPPELRAHLLAGYQRAAHDGTVLRVRLRIGPPELAALPWEFLYDPAEDDYLCLGTPLVRHLDIPRPARPLTVTPPLRILGMIARPDQLDALDANHERRRLTDALADLEAAGRVQLSWVTGQTWWDLQRALDRGAWHIFHFIGHGALDPQNGEGVLGLAAEGGGVHRIAASDLARLLVGQSALRLVMLNSCETARATAADRFSSTASVLMRRGIPAVVAMQYEITDAAAIAFARGFYTALASQHPVEQATTRGRIAVKLARQNTLEWATPVIYLRSATGTLFDLTDIPITPAPPPLATPPPGRQADPDEAAAPLAPHQGPAAPPTYPARAPSAHVPPPTPPAHRDRPVELIRVVGHRTTVRGVAFSPDGSRLATASWDKTARVWDAVTGRQLLQVRHNGLLSRVAEVAFSPDGSRLATASWDGTARVWDAGQELTRLTHVGCVNGVAFSPDGTRLATAGQDKTARVWDAVTGQELTQLTHERSVNAVAFSPDGTRLATASDDKTARVWDAVTGQELTQLTHEGSVQAVAFSPDGTRLATASDDMTARVWDAVTGQELTQLTHGRSVLGVHVSAGGVRAVAFSPDGSRLATASDDKTARVWTLNLE